MRMICEFFQVLFSQKYLTSAARVEIRVKLLLNHYRKPVRNSMRLQLQNMCG